MSIDRSNRSNIRALGSCDQAADIEVYYERQLKMPTKTQKNKGGLWLGRDSFVFILEYKTIVSIIFVKRCYAVNQGLPIS